MGCKKFIACGMCGVLQKDIAVGHLMIPISAVRDDSDNSPSDPPARCPGYEGVAKFSAGAFLVDGEWENDLATIDWEVIGNILDNPELINRK
jgi:uridine phosphorylase